MTQALFPKEPGPISVALDESVKQYSVFVGNGVGRYSSQEGGAERLSIQRMVTINRTLYIGDRISGCGERLLHDQKLIALSGLERVILQQELDWEH
uniref:Uncharacterized protein n=1 Tax=Sphaerodactylus townsendi TaxID=933632 RepID=A0ACB8F117_9SAUR